jgi:hypothetical protein
MLPNKTTALEFSLFRAALLYEIFWVSEISVQMWCSRLSLVHIKMLFDISQVEYTKKIAKSSPKTIQK